MLLLLNYLQTTTNRQSSGEISEIPHFQQDERGLRFVRISSGWLTFRLTGFKA
jgi:hypothetical protein